MHRRRALLATTGTAMAGLSGCIDVVLGTEPLTFDATAATVADGVLDDTGYDRVDHGTTTVEEDVEIVGRSRTVRVTNHRVDFEKDAPLDPDALASDADVPEEALAGETARAFVTVLTTPQAEVLGRELNPIASESPAGLVTMVEDRNDDVEAVEPREEDPDPVPIDGAETEQVTFDATVSHDLGDLEVVLHVTEAAPLGDDLVVTFAGYPAAAADDERAAARAMMAGVEPGP